MLRSAKWEHEKLRQSVQNSIYTELAHDESRWDIDDTGFLKQGHHSVGVQPQYSGTAGKTANCQISVCLAFSSFKGYAITDFRLYLPQSWVNNSELCQKAGIPEESRVFRTKTQLAKDMLSDALELGFRANCVTADAAYGKSKELRDFLKTHQLNFGLGVPKTTRVNYDNKEMNLEDLAQYMSDDWIELPIPGSQGYSVYQWAYVTVSLDQSKYGIMLRRSSKETRFFLTWSTQRKDMMYWVRHIAGRWDVERCFQEAKQEMGLDEYQVRHWQGWHRHMVLCWFLHWILSRIKLQNRSQKWTLPQLRQVLRIFLLAAGTCIKNLTHWLFWRRKHNARAAKAHRKRQRDGMLCR